MSPRFDTGWIKVYRKLSWSDAGTNGYCLAITATLLMWASRFPSTIRWRGKPREVPAGSVLIGIRELADHLQFSKDTVYRQLKYLAERDTIRLETATQGTLVTIQKWEEYQTSDEILRHAEGHECDTAKDTSRTLAERQPTLNGEVKKRRSNIVHSFDLESAYQKYPRKEGKTSGFKKLAREIKSQHDYDALIRAIENYAREKQGVENRFLKVFSTFAGEWREWVTHQGGGAAEGKASPEELKTDIKALQEFAHA